MKIILLKNVIGLGKLGDTVIVKSGYARNYLIPYGKAILANINNISSLDFSNDKLHIFNKLKIKQSYRRIQDIKSLSSIVMHASSGEQGKLFGSISDKDIADKITSLGVTVYSQEILISNELIRDVGNYIVVFQPHQDVSCHILIKVISKNSI